MKSWEAHTPSGIFLESSQCHAELLRLSRHFFTTETGNAGVGYVKMEKGVEICCSRWWLAWELWMVDWNEWHSQSAAEKGNKQGRAFGSVILSFSLSKREQPWSMSEAACWHRVTYFLPVCGSPANHCCLIMCLKLTASSGSGQNNFAIVGPKSGEGV